jgi:hypothetical protein
MTGILRPYARRTAQILSRRNGLGGETLIILYIYCDVSPESRDIGARIHGAAKHVSPTTNNNSRERYVTTRELEPLWKVFYIQSSENLLKEYSRRSQRVLR